MHRTTTTAALLVTVAVSASALAGCVTVQRPAAPGPVLAPSRPSVPRPEGRAEVQVVQAPAREALEMVGPSRTPGPAAPTAPAQRRTAPLPGAGGAGEPPRSRPRTRPSRPDARRHVPPRVEIPDVEEEVRRNTDVCALGRTYGGWRRDSPEATICAQAYGR
ncbi:hypothetical protein J2X68_006277 [Streptomyces sp. 3330]|uniref:hypothetical protein n=1 Tax=Streptomyces sp. 3330 TaxID=2817755 RepID=UPI0028664FF2|nr:hypothetical protein [Streptomyces sp. 3330]MDR6979541.1 hypothetical protein [Streptomyces sp. 3330]